GVAAGRAGGRPRLGAAQPLVIGGRRIGTAERIVSVNPSRAGEVVGRVAAAGTAEIDQAVAAAARAFAGWRDAGADARAGMLGRVAARLRERRPGRTAGVLYRARKPWPRGHAHVAEAIQF